MKPNPEEKTPKKESSGSLKQIRTFQGDVAEAIKRQQESLVSIQRAEQAKKNVINVSGRVDGGDTGRKKSGSNPFALFLGILLLLALSAAGVWYVYDRVIIRSVVPVPTSLANRFVTPNSEVGVLQAETSRQDLVNSILNASTDLSQGELRHVVLKKTVEREGKVVEVLLSTEEFLKTLESAAPGSLVRAFGPLFMYGVLGRESDSGRTSSFLIINVDSFENVFAGMLVWEEGISRDLGSLLATSNILNNLDSNPTFVDITDRNKDIRAIVYEGEPIFLYSFFDNDKLIITDKLETLRSLVERLTREKLSR